MDSDSISKFTPARPCRRRPSREDKLANLIAHLAVVHSSISNPEQSTKSYPLVLYNQQLKGRGAAAAKAIRAEVTSA